jgi:polysaccharide deacetylase 2 family uncharacterized protein YibQ
VRGFLAGAIFLTLSLSLSLPADADPQADLQERGTAYLAIIIDDVGNNFSRGKRAIDLPGDLTYAVLPYTRHGSSLARHAHVSGKEVMVHMPMANISEQDIGPGGLIPALRKESFLARLDKALARVPFATGVNNHMGSFMTQQRTEMAWLMKELGRRNLFFVDSRTTPRTVAYEVAQQNRVFSSSRDVFLDNDLTLYDIDVAFRRLVRTARQNGSAIAIGHPHRETLDYLELALPQLESLGIRLVPASTLIAIQKMADLQFAENEQASQGAD